MKTNKLKNWMLDSEFCDLLPMTSYMPLVITLLVINVRGNRTFSVFEWLAVTVSVLTGIAILFWWWRWFYKKS